jgi:hypothetical protein
MPFAISAILINTGLQTGAPPWVHPKAVLNPDFALEKSRSEANQRSQLQFNDL